MKLIEALNITRAMQHRKGGALRCFLATGFNALHLKTFLAAELGLLFFNQKIEISDGLYGDISGNIDRLANNDCDFGIVLIEWPDLDPRLGIRNAGRWTANELQDILATAKTRALQIQRAIEEVSQRTLLVVGSPTLPLPPFSFAPSWQAASFDLNLRAVAHSLSCAVAQCSQVRLLNTQRLDLDSPLKERLDVESEALSGFPYRLPHASVVAGLLVRLAQRPAPKKGLITDLDQTLWSGILGEDGVDGISWDLEHHSQIHGFYQRFLGALMSEGVLIGIASKNDSVVVLLCVVWFWGSALTHDSVLVEEAFRRSDFALSPAALFPVEASWKPKSQSVARILKTWNVGSDDVVFIDDSPIELAEVNAAYPAMECLQFPTKDSAAIYEVMLRLRDLFGKSDVSEEDSIRSESIRRSYLDVHVHNQPQSAGFLEQAEAQFDFNFTKLPADPRVVDLVNKTNQFNLNGNRYSEAQWTKLLSDPATLLMVTTYRDKFGPLGKIAVLAGRLNAGRLTMNTWVMSCRAFSRRIEYKCLEELMARFDFEEIEFEYLRTERNGPLRECLGDILVEPPSPNCTMFREELEARLKSLQRPQEISNG
jgi:FkbH-like protein